MGNRYSCKKTQHSREEYFQYCEECFQKQLIIDKQRAEIEYLRAQLNYRKRKDREEYFGSSTPSSKIHIKSNTSKNKSHKKSGAKEGHVGNGRIQFSEKEADTVIDLKVNNINCPECGGKLEIKETSLRSIVDTVLLEAKKIVYRCQVKRCLNCRTEVKHTPTILPKHKYGNALISNAIIMHYLQGIPLKRIENMWGNVVIKGNLIKIFHKLAKKWDPAIEKLKEEYRNSKVKHADETGWRNSGNNGYSWLFCADKTSLFMFKDTRSSQVPKDVLGSHPIAGTLIVDRYAAYNKSPCKIQYCYAHLLRDLQDLEKEFSKNKEVKRFVKDMASLLAKAMGLRSKDISDKQYYKKAKELKEKIMINIRAPAKHLGIQKYQDIFRENQKKLYHWEYDRDIPAENNRAERELRPTVIARKVSFGSQSKDGAYTRSVMMSILHTAAKRLNGKMSIQEWFKLTLDELADNQNINLYSLIPKS